MSSGPTNRCGILSTHRGHLVVVAVADHAALRRAGRARGVDVGEEVVLVDLRRLASSSASGWAAACSRPRASSSARSANVRTWRSRQVRTLRRPSRAARRPRRARRPTRSGRARRRRRAASCSRRPAPRSPPTRPSAKSNRHHSRLVEPRIAKASPFFDPEREQPVRERRRPAGRPPARDLDPARRRARRGRRARASSRATAFRQSAAIVLAHGAKRTERKGTPVHA